MSRKLSILIFVADILLMLLFIFSRWHINITLNGEEEMTIPYGQTFVDPGATAEITGKDIAAFDKDLKVKTSDDVDLTEPGEYTIVYRASRLFYRATAERTVKVVDMTAPTLILHETKTELDAGDVWTDSFEARDDHDGDLTGQVQISGTVDTKTAGMYELKYSVTDAAGNTATATRNVVVYGVSEPVSGPKIVFLTFDDGPSSNTDRLLQILADHDVKATFFVTANRREYIDCLGKEAAAGHTVAVHSLTHDFDSIYRSEDAYWDDFDAMNDIIEEQTGFRSRIFRFPGGSSNTVSSYNPGIMTRLTQQSGEKGLDYFDWNVDSNDAGGTTTSQGVYENVIAGIQRNDVSVVLCHDTHDYTVGAIDDILTWGEENGYTFLPLAKGITVCHHGVAN